MSAERVGPGAEPATNFATADGTDDGTASGAPSARRILHIDMDAFFASIEQRDKPELRGKPVAVGGGVRGVVAAASYEARRFGVRSAMPASRAQRLCPELIFVKHRMDVYREVSGQVRAIFGRYTDLIEPLSIDEAFLDVTDPKRGPRSGTLLAKAIKADVRRETGLTASAGISYCKFLAKIASGVQKPDGLTVITPEDAEAFIAELPIGAFYGVGPKTAERLRALGVVTGRDLRRLSQDQLERAFGKHGGTYWRMARGIDERPVNAERERKSVGRETTFLRDVRELPELERTLGPLAEQVAERLARGGWVASAVTVKVKFDDFEQITRQMQTARPVSEAHEILAYARHLLRAKVRLARPVRLVGIAVHHLEDAETVVVQPALFPEVGLPEAR